MVEVCGVGRTRDVLPGRVGRVRASGLQAGGRVKELRYFLLEHIPTRRIDRIMDAAVLFMFGAALVGAVLRFR